MRKLRKYWRDFVYIGISSYTLLFLGFLVNSFSEILSSALQVIGILIAAGGLIYFFMLIEPEGHPTWAG